MSAHLEISDEDREQLAEQVGVGEEDLDEDVLLGYVEELRELGHGTEAARVVAFLGPGYSDDADAKDEDEDDALYRQLSGALGLPGPSDDSARSYEQEEEDELFNDFAPFLGFESEE